MDQERALPAVHPAGEPAPVVGPGFPGAETLDTFAGTVKVEWDRSSPLTPLGQAVYFIEFLKVSGVFDALNADCPLHYTSPNAPEVRDVIGTWVLSVLAGHRRYAHVTALRSDSVLPELMGMSRIVSEIRCAAPWRQSPRNKGSPGCNGILTAVSCRCLASAISSISIRR